MATLLRRAGWALALLYVLAVGFTVFWPVHVDSGDSGETLRRLLEAGHSAGWLPAWFGYAQVEWLSNVVMFMPGGLLAVLLLRPRSPWLVPLGGLAATLFIESVQHFIPGRTSSPLDVLANTLGCVIGWVLGLLVWCLAEKHNRKARQSPSNTPVEALKH